MKPVALFSKHLGWLTVDQLGPVASEIGLEAVQLTVRPGGHVEPERAAADLTRAVRTLRLAGIAVPSAVTAVIDPAAELTRSVVGAIADAGIPMYRMGWYRLPFGSSADEIRDAVDRAREGLAGFARLNEELGVVGCYQNHAGAFVGASPWQLWELVRDAPSDYLGLEFDLRHAMIEGWFSWQSAFELLRPRIASIDVKDFRWDPTTSEPVSVPLGEGVVDFPPFLDRLAAEGFDGPAVLHLEYHVGGHELQGTPGSVAEAPRDPLTRAAGDAIRADLARLDAMLPAADRSSGEA